MVKLEPLYTASQNVKWCHHFVKIVRQFLNRLKIELTSAPIILPKGTENKCLHKNLYINAHSKIILNSQKAEYLKVPKLMNG